MFAEARPSHIARASSVIVFAFPVIGETSTESRDEERALVLRAKSGDRQALGQLLTIFGPNLFRVIIVRVGSEAIAKDILSETYARVVEKIGHYEWQAAGFFPWLRTVGLRIAIDHLRRRNRFVLWQPEDFEREAVSSDADANDDAFSTHDADVVRGRVKEALSRINPRYAEVIQKRIMEEIPRERLAQELGITPATFDVLLHRAVAALKKELSRETQREES